MKNKTNPLLVAAVLAVGLAGAVQAAFINGSINFSSGAGGGITLRAADGSNTNSTMNAYGVNDWASPQVDLTSGDFTAIPAGTGATFTQPWIFDPSTPTSPLWTVTSGGTTFTFNLTSAVVEFRSASGLVVSGTGMVTGTGFTATPGTWSFTPTGNVGGKFSWAGSTTAVPDGGTTVALLGGAMLGLAGLRRKFAKR